MTVNTSTTAVSKYGMDFEEAFSMKLYDNDSYREEFMEEVYKLLADDPDNSRANEIIDLFDDAPEFNPPNEPLTLEQAKKEKYIWFEPLKDWGKVTPDGVLFFGTEERMRWETLNEYWGDPFKVYRYPPEGEEDQHGDHRL